MERKIELVKYAVQSKIMQKLREKLDYNFKNKSWLEKALTHASRGGKYFQRLEFLGDRVLNLSLTLIFLEEKKEYQEGQLAQAISLFGSSKILEKVALKWELDNALNCAPAQKKSILSDACESVLGAIFIDSQENIQLLKGIVKKNWNEYIQQYMKDEEYQDSKTRLQELCHQLYGTVPEYNNELHKGQAHNPTFLATVQIKDKTNKVLHSAKGLGTSHKEAEKDAAKKLLAQLNKNHN